MRCSLWKKKCSKTCRAGCGSHQTVYSSRTSGYWSPPNGHYIQHSVSGLHVDYVHIAQYRKNTCLHTQGIEITFLAAGQNESSFPLFYQVNCWVHSQGIFFLLIPEIVGQRYLPPKASRFEGEVTTIVHSVMKWHCLPTLRQTLLDQHLDSNSSRSSRL